MLFDDAMDEKDVERTWIEAFDGIQEVVVTRGRRFWNVINEAAST